MDDTSVDDIATLTQAIIAGDRDACARFYDNSFDHVYRTAHQSTGFNEHETLLTKETVGRLVAKWKFPTAGPVAASPVVATVDVPGEGPVRIVVVGSYDGNVYAIRATDGSELWRFAVKPHPGVSFGLITSSATIAQVGGRQRVYVAGGETMYALDAATRELLWEFDAGTGCIVCGTRAERNEILSSPAVLPEQDLVLFGMDVNENTPGKGGFFALSAEDGRLRWYFDVDTGAVCRPDDGDDVRHFGHAHARPGRRRGARTATLAADRLHQQILQ